MTLVKVRAHGAVLELRPQQETQLQEPDLQARGNHTGAIRVSR